MCLLARLKCVSSRVATDTWSFLWDLQSLILAKYLESSGCLGADPVILELGSGTGLVGVVASVLGAKKSILTDLDYTLVNINRTVAANELNLKGEVIVTELDWYAEFPNQIVLYDTLHESCGCVCRFAPQKSSASLSDIDFVLAADVVWVETLIQPLVSTMRYIAKNSTRSDGTVRKPIFLVSHQTRSTASDDIFFTLLKAYGFNQELVPITEHHRRFRDPAIKIIRLEFTGE